MAAPFYVFIRMDQTGSYVRLVNAVLVAGG